MSLIDGTAKVIMCSLFSPILFHHVVTDCQICVSRDFVIATEEEKFTASLKLDGDPSASNFYFLDHNTVNHRDSFQQNQSIYVNGESIGWMHYVQMSKSATSDMSRINLLDTPDVSQIFHTIPVHFYKARDTCARE